MHQPRDSHGHFLPKTDVQAEVKTSTPNLNPEFEKPLVNLSVSNPFRKILYWIDQIRRHQTTTFALKLSIPLIALPVLVGAVALASFQYGKASVSPNLPYIPNTPNTPTPTETKVTKVGKLQASKGENISYILFVKNEDGIFLTLPEKFEVKQYLNKQVLVTGILDITSNTLKVESIAEIETSNETSISPIPSLTSTPTPTLIPSQSSSPTPTP